MAFPQNKIKEKLEELIKLRLNKGVSPVELSSNIYNEEYTEIKLKRNFESIMCHVYFYDESLFAEKKAKYEYRYIYNKEFFLQQISQIKNKEEALIWDRKNEEYNLLLDLINLIEKNEGTLDTKLFNTLPNDLKAMIINYIENQEDKLKVL